MHTFLQVMGAIALVAGLFVATSIRSDIQIQIFATCIIGSALLFGLASVHDRLRQFTPPPTDPTDRH